MTRGAAHRDPRRGRRGRGDARLPPALELTGPVDSAVPDDLRPDLLAVLREALSNAARHAQATRCDVAVAVAGGRLSLSRSPTTASARRRAARGGLVNMRERADRHGGEFTSAGRAARHRLRWSVPLPG